MKKVTTMTFGKRSGNNCISDVFIRSRRKSSLLIWLTLMCTGALAGNIYVSPLIGDNMVIQAGVPFEIAGKYIPAQTLNVIIDKRTIRTTSDKEGNWALKFPAFASGKVLTIEIKSDKESLVIRNVLTGEVWLCAGGSDMTIPAGQTDVKRGLGDIDKTEIRYFKIKTNSTGGLDGKWVMCAPENIDACSAVGLGFAWFVNNTTRQPVGLILNAVNDSPIESWMAPASAKTKKDNAGLLFSTMVYPIKDVAMKGVLWYHGESNLSDPFKYCDQLTRLIRSWRKNFRNQSLAFYIVQNSQVEVAPMKGVSIVSSTVTGKVSDSLLTRKMQIGRRIASRVLQNEYKISVENIRMPTWESRELTSDEITSFTSGVSSVRKKAGDYYFYRLPDSAMNVLSANDVYWIRAQSTSGVEVHFFTNSDKLFISGKVVQNTPETYPFNVLCNGRVVGCLPGIADTSTTFSMELDLAGKRMKKVEILFPAYAQGTLKNIAIRKNSKIQPVQFKGKMLSLGNSINQWGGDYNGFLRIAADSLNFSLMALGIGGHVFQPEYLTGRFMDNPDIITVGYGTNDWFGGRSSKAAELFFQRLCGLYPNVPIFFLEPLQWVTPFERNSAGLSLNDFRRELRAIAGKFKQVTVIDFKNLIPNDPDVYYPDLVHPNRTGQKIMGANLARILASALRK